jgi:hypothetical protein
MSSYIIFTFNVVNMKIDSSFQDNFSYSEED